MTPPPVNDGPGAAPTELPFVSVITPFYNSAAFLAECIESVLAQDYGNFEYILSDNASTDGSLAIAQRYAAADPRVRVITHTEFIDQDANYNRALGYASPASAYVKIAQADDVLMPNCVSAMVGLAAANPSVGIVGCCFITGDALAGHGLAFDRDVFTGREACRTRLLSGGTYFGSPTCLLYRADIVRTKTPFYPPDETNADTVACFQILGDSDFGLVRQILCSLRRGNPSVSESLRRIGVTAFFNYALVERFGPRFLTADELAARRKVLRRLYVQRLARAVMVRREPGYWQFQRAALASLGQTLPVGEIALSIADYIFDKLLNPRQTVEGVFAALRRRGRGQSRRHS